VDELSHTQPDRLAVAFKSERLSYLELAQTSRAMAALLAKEGIAPGDRVLLCAVSKPSVIACYLALQRLGAVTAFADKKDQAERIVWMHQFVEAKLVLGDKPLGEHGDGIRALSLNALYQRAREKAAALGEGDAFPDGASSASLPALAAHRPNPADLSDLIFTSGSTGEPKGVMLSRGAVAEIARATAEGVGYCASDVILLPLPLSHSFALRVLRAALLVGATIALQNGFTFAREVERNQEAFACTTIAMVPSSVELLSRQMEGRFADIMGRFRLIEVSAGSLSAGQRLRLVRELPTTRIWNVWGSSETGGIIFADVSALAREEGAPHIASLGTPAPQVELVTLAPDGTLLAETDSEHPGRMALKTPTAMSGYWARPDLSSEALRDGLLLTNDLVYQQDGYLFFLGRKDDLINVGGEKLSPLEVENAASQSPQVEDCACLGIDDPEGVLGSVPVLLVKAHATLDEAALASFLATRLERHKLPVAYLQVDEIPRNRMQKIDRRALRALWESRDAAPMNELTRALLTRRSVRRFTDDPISHATLETLVRCGYYAPSGHNMQTWRFTVITRPELIERLREATAQAAKLRNVNFYGFGNPVALILVSNDERNPNGCQDASAASENIMLAAWSYGIGSTWLNPLMRLRDVEPVKTVLDELGIPARHVVWSMIELGYPAAEGALIAKKSDVVAWFE
jgi:long-chain acyl-CoA synthetase